MNLTEYPTLIFSIQGITLCLLLLVVSKTLIFINILQNFQLACFEQNWKQIIFFGMSYLIGIFAFLRGITFILIFSLVTIFTFFNYFV